MRAEDLSLLQRSIPGEGKGISLEELIKKPFAPDRTGAYASLNRLEKKGYISRVGGLISRTSKGEQRCEAEERAWKERRKRRYG